MLALAALDFLVPGTMVLHPPMLPVLPWLALNLLPLSVPVPVPVPVQQRWVLRVHVPST